MEKLKLSTLRWIWVAITALYVILWLTSVHENIVAYVGNIAAGFGGAVITMWFAEKEMSRLNDAQVELKVDIEKNRKMFVKFVENMHTAGAADIYKRGEGRTNYAGAADVFKGVAKTDDEVDAPEADIDLSGAPTATQMYPDPDIDEDE